MGEKSFTFIEDTDDDNGYDFVSGVVRFGEIDVKSVEELVDEVLARLGEDDCISDITIIGHGSPGNISVGDGQGHDDQKRIGLGNEAVWGPQLDRIACRFCENGTVYLRGCNTGANGAGARLLHRVKKRLICATVSAPTGVCSPLHTTGEDQVSRPGEKKPPKAIPNPDKGKKKKGKAKGAEVALVGGTSYRDTVAFEPRQVNAARLVAAMPGYSGLEPPDPETGLSLPPAQREVLLAGLADAVPESYPGYGFDINGLLQLRIRRGRESVWLPPGAVLGGGTYFSAFGTDTSAVWILPRPATRMLWSLIRGLGGAR